MEVFPEQNQREIRDTKQEMGWSCPLIELTEKMERNELMPYNRGSQTYLSYHPLFRKEMTLHCWKHVFLFLWRVVHFQ